jgi:S-adenosylmethionine hydrolase
VIEADGRWYVGPDNGLFELALRRAEKARVFAIDWRPKQVSASFHGRDVFAPVAARLHRGKLPAGRPTEPLRFPDWPDDLAEIVYVDHYGNAMTGLRAAMLPAGTELEVAGVRITRARTFSNAPEGQPLWYENANGLAEIALRGGSAAERLALAPGHLVTVHRPD